MNDNEHVNSRQYLSFILAGEEYASDILKVQEIRDWTSSTFVPNSPQYIEGILNLRGNIIPIINLRTRFNLPNDEKLVNRIVIVLTIETGGRNRSMGLLVDAVAETYDVDMDKVRSAPTGSSVIDDEFITGLTTLDNKMVILLDVDELLSSGELGLAAV
ncbi:MAG: purine-binding chemotaxis protein CheW [Gammaproteobacteria bacterium]|nr:purine-binding chemotaxis protein CheW [Gammaproteobacteria bacterium]